MLKYFPFHLLVSFPFFCTRFKLKFKTGFVLFFFKLNKDVGITMLCIFVIVHNVIATSTVLYVFIASNNIVITHYYHHTIIYHYCQNLVAYYCYCIVMCHYLFSLIVYHTKMICYCYYMFFF